MSTAEHPQRCDDRARSTSRHRAPFITCGRKTKDNPGSAWWAERPLGDLLYLNTNNRRSRAAHFTPRTRSRSRIKTRSRRWCCKMAVAKDRGGELRKLDVLTVACRIRRPRGHARRHDRDHLAFHVAPSPTSSSRTRNPPRAQFGRLARTYARRRRRGARFADANPGTLAASSRLDEANDYIASTRPARRRSTCAPRQ